MDPEWIQFLSIVILCIVALFHIPISLTYVVLWILGKVFSNW